MQCQTPALCLEARWEFAWPPATSHPHGNAIVGLATSTETGSSKPHRLAANADESELHLDIPLHAERILILNYHLIHRGWLPARKPQLQSTVCAERWRA